MNLAVSCQVLKDFTIIFLHVNGSRHFGFMITRISIHAIIFCFCCISHYFIFRSFLRNHLIKWVEMSVRPSIRPSVRLLTFSAFSISSLITGPYNSKFHMLILEMGPHNRSGSDFAISEGYSNKLISYAVEALSLARSLVLSLQIYILIR